MDDSKIYPDVPLSEDAGDASPASSEFSSSNAASGGFYPAEPYQNGTYSSTNADRDSMHGQANAAAGYTSSGSAPAGQTYGVSQNASGYSQNSAPAGQAYGLPGSAPSYRTQNNGYRPSYDREIQPKQGQAVSIVSLVFGILSVVCCWTFILPFIFGLVAIICGIVGAAKRQKKALWLIGLITGVLGIVITVAMVASLIPILVEIVEEIERHGGTLTPQDIQRIFREYGIEINIGAKLFGGFFV